MSYFKSFADLLYSNTKPTPTPNEAKEGAFTGMKEEDITETATIFKEENNALKERLLLSEKENKHLKELVTGSKSNINQSYSSFIIDSLKSALELENSTQNEAKPNSFQSFLFNQLAFYDGLEEDDVYSLNHFSINKGDDIELNHDIYSFKQMVIERNYHQLLRNMTASKDINQLLPKKNKEDDKNNQPLSSLDKQNNEDINKTTDFEVITNKDGILAEMSINTSPNDSKVNQKKKPVVSKSNKKNKTQKENQANILSGKKTSIIHYI